MKFRLLPFDIDSTASSCKRCGASASNLQRVKRTRWHKWFFRRRYRCSACGREVMLPK